MSNDQNLKIEVRDLRSGEWIWTHKAVLFSRYISASEFKVYCGLAAYAGNVDQQSWPSLQTLATKLNLSRSTVIRSLKIIENAGLIRIDRRDGNSNLYSLLKCEDIREPTPSKREQSPHHRLVEVFHKATMHFRKIKPVFSPRDVAALKRVLASGILTEQQIEQLMIYFLADYGLRKFSPSMSTFFSSGIFNGLMNRMKNGETFWKDLDRYATEFYTAGPSTLAAPSLSSVPIAIPDMVAMVANLSAKMSGKPYEAKVLQAR